MTPKFGIAFAPRKRAIVEDGTVRLLKEKCGPCTQVPSIVLQDLIQDAIPRVLSIYSNDLSIKWQSVHVPRGQFDRLVECMESIYQSQQASGLRRALPVDIKFALRKCVELAG